MRAAADDEAEAELPEPPSCCVLAPSREAVVVRRSTSSVRSSGRRRLQTTAATMPCEGTLAAATSCFVYCIHRRQRTSGLLDSCSIAALSCALSIALDQMLSSIAVDPMTSRIIPRALVAMSLTRHTSHRLGMHLSTLRCSRRTLLGAFDALRQRCGRRLTLRHGGAWLRRASLAHVALLRSGQIHAPISLQTHNSCFPRYML